jgi:coenzyme F420 biosynthesis associated uncharacterized protein
MADVIAWDTAAQVGRRLARRQAPLTSYERRSLEDDFERMTAQAEELVSAETGMVSASGAARGRVADRSQWVDANVASFQRLLRPLVDKVAERMTSGGRRSPVPLSVTKQIAGTELGLLLGWMSGRVLGQYDQLLIEDDRPEDQDIVYYVGPNIVGVERKYGFDPSQFRLWIALHEVTHRMQFTAVPWLRPHFLGLVEKTMSGIDPDPRALAAALKRSADSIRSGRNPLDEGGIAALIAGPEQLDAIRQIGGMMSLLEGHGDVTMDRAGAELLPDAARFSSTLRERRRQRGFAKAIMVLIGLDAKMKQYEQGEQFIAAVEAAGGRQLMDRVWAGPDNLPSLDEIRDPAQWVRRMTAGSVITSSSGT